MAADPTLLDGVDPYDFYDAEATRLDAHYAGLEGSAWQEPTACEGWDQHDLLAHLAASEAYNHACMADQLPAFLETMGARGVTDLDSFNAAGVADGEGRPGPDLLGEWREACLATRSWMRRHHGEDLPTMVGPYPVDWQAFHLANELAIHADDAGAPVDAAEAEARTAWLAQVARFMVSETGKDVTVSDADGGFRVAVAGVTGVLSPAELVAAANGRLPAASTVDPALAEGLRLMG